MPINADPTLTDSELVARCAAVIDEPKAAPPDSFVLHAPLELLARALLLDRVHPDARPPARGTTAMARRHLRGCRPVRRVDTGRRFDPDGPPRRVARRRWSRTDPHKSASARRRSRRVVRDAARRNRGRALPRLGPRMATRPPRERSLIGRPRGAPRRAPLAGRPGKRLHLPRHAPRRLEWTRGRGARGTVARQHYAPAPWPDADTRTELDAPHLRRAGSAKLN